MRVDLNNPKITAKLDETIVNARYGPNASVDVCRNCYELFEFDDDIDHPPYGDMEIDTCIICAAVLDEFVDA